MPEKTKFTLISIEPWPGEEDAFYRARIKAEWNQHTITADIKVLVEDGVDASERAFHRFKHLLQKAAEEFPEKATERPRSPPQP